MAKRRRRGRKKRFKLWSKQSDYITTEGTTVSMDSTWEVACAKRLDELGIKWIRNPSIKLKYITRSRRIRNYIPDFYLPDYDIYIEVKGYWTDAARHKIKSVQINNDVKLLILESLDAIGKLDEESIQQLVDSV
jgi:predicted nuclease of restriction endonuclease-like RecB superfamily